MKTGKEKTKEQMEFIMSNTEYKVELKWPSDCEVEVTHIHRDSGDIVAKQRYGVIPGKWYNWYIVR